MNIAIGGNLTGLGSEVSSSNEKKRYQVKSLTVLVCFHFRVNQSSL